jgi:hypothetical protein
LNADRQTVINMHTTKQLACSWAVVRELLGRLFANNSNSLDSRGGACLKSARSKSCFACPADFFLLLPLLLPFAFLAGKSTWRLMWLVAQSLAPPHTSRSLLGLHAVWSVAQFAVRTLHHYRSAL